MKNQSIASDTGPDDEMARSVAQGLAYLATNREAVEFVLIDGKWHFALENTATAKALGTAMEADIDHTGFSYGSVLKRVFKEATEAMGYVADIRAFTEENSSNVIATLRPPAP